MLCIGLSVFLSLLACVDVFCFLCVTLFYVEMSYHACVCKGVAVEISRMFYEWL